MAAFDRGLGDTYADFVCISDFPACSGDGTDTDLMKCSPFMMLPQLLSAHSSVEVTLYNEAVGKEVVLEASL